MTSYPGLQTQRVRRGRTLLELGKSWGAKPWFLAGGALAAAALLAFWVWRPQPEPPALGRTVTLPVAPKVEGAIAAAQERLRENPQDIEALLELGILHFEKGKEFYADAVNELEDARDLGALDSRIFYCLGIMYQELGLPSFALEEYRRYLRNRPQDREMRLMAAKLLYLLGHYAEAVGEFERLKFHHPKDSLVEENLGLSLWAAKLHSRAAEAFTALGTFGPAEARRAQYYLGQMAFEQLRYHAALEHLRAAMEGPALPTALGAGGDFGVPADKLQATMAMAYQKLDRWDEAKAAWERVLELAPKDPKAQVALKELNRRRPPARKSGKSSAPKP